MPKMDSIVLNSKFRGSLLGALLGDCLGAPFEGEKFERGLKLTLKNNFDKLEGPYFHAPERPYTDDTAMSKLVIKNLIEHKGIQQKILAVNFVKEFFLQPHRGYGEGVVTVFEELRKTKFENPTGPASQQFFGTGSYGNGAAMRVAPVGLFCFNKSIEQVKCLATLQAEITHTNKLGIDGAVLQAIAVQQSLLMNPNEPFNGKQFIEKLLEKISCVEKTDEFEIGTDTPYKNKLNKLLYFLKNPERAHDSSIREQIGNSVEAINSVPTAIYCFVMGHDDIPGIATKNAFRRTIEYAISLGGDTDTIASMAGSICGAYYGDTIIPANFIKHCEDADEIKHLSDALYTVSVSC